MTNEYVTLSQMVARNVDNMTDREKHDFISKVRDVLYLDVANDCYRADGPDYFKEEDMVRLLKQLMEEYRLQPHHRVVKQSSTKSEDKEANPTIIVTNSRGHQIQLNKDCVIRDGLDAYGKSALFVTRKVTGTDVWDPISVDTTIEGQRTAAELKQRLGLEREEIS